jgi:glutamate racemase
MRSRGIRAEVIYFADQAHVPYGGKSDQELHGLLRENLGWLKAQDVDLVAMGCNTSCAVAQRLGWPSAGFRYPVQDLIRNAGASFRDRHLRRVVVLATAATVRSGAYAQAITTHAPETTVFELAAPEFVPIVESGDLRSARARAAVEAVIAQFPPEIEAIVYGCTHYPLLDAHFAELLPTLERIDPALAQAHAVAELVGIDGDARTTYITNGDPIAFERNVRAWTGDQVGTVTALTTLA